MPLYSTLASLSQTAASNAADGAVDAPSTIDQQTNLLASFIAQIRDGNGSTNSPSYRNRLRNGRFNVNQRAVSGSVVLAAGVYGHDGWKAGAAGCTYTFSGGVLTISAGSLSQVVEDKDIEGGTFCLSWTGSATGRLNNSGAYGASGLTGSLAALTSAYVEFSTGTLSAVQLEPGSMPSPLERAPYALELTRCQRYYQTSYENEKPGAVSSSGNRLVTLNFSNTTPGLVFTKSFETRMRVAPTITFYNPSSGATGSMRNETLGTDLPASVFGTPGPGGFSAYNTAAASATINIYSVHYAASAEL